MFVKEKNIRNTIELRTLEVNILSFLSYHCRTSKMNSEEVETNSHKGEKRKNYTMEFKRNAISFAEKPSNNAAAKRSFPLNKKE